MSKLTVVNRLVAQDNTVKGAVDVMCAGTPDALAVLSIEELALYTSITAQLAEVRDDIKTLLGIMGS